MFQYHHNQDILQSDADAIINTVNCVGIMGKGLALKFKEKFPENYKAYRKYCDDNKLKIGNVFITEFGGKLSADHKYLINFPTKEHWRGKSKIEYIAKGLDDLLLQIENHHIASVAVPPLGCGNGGLDWDEVHDLLKEKLNPIADKIDIIIYAPKTSIETELAMTFNRALMIKILHDFAPYFNFHMSHIIIQKLVYFLKFLDVPDYPKFQKHKYGPYSELLKKSLMKMADKNFIKLSNDFTDNPDSMIIATEQAIKDATEFFENLTKDAQQEFTDIMSKLSKLIEGYESSFGMELLSTTHFLINNNATRSPQITAITKGFAKWSERKKELFDRDVIELAYHRLKDDGLA